MRDVMATKGGWLTQCDKCNYIKCFADDEERYCPACSLCRECGKTIGMGPRKFGVYLR